MLFRLLKHILKGYFSVPEDKESRKIATQNRSNNAIPMPKKVLNVGGRSKDIPLPHLYHGWEHILLDIDERGNPDILCDARSLTNLVAEQYDAIYCSHNLEHYYKHDVHRVLVGFHHVLKDGGFIHIRVPDMGELMRKVVNEGLGIDDLLYVSPAGPIHVHDVIYGYATEIEQSGNDYFAHKTGFTQKSLVTSLRVSGFSSVESWCNDLEIVAIAFKTFPTEYGVALLNIINNPEFGICSSDTNSTS